MPAAANLNHHRRAVPIRTGNMRQQEAQRDDVPTSTTGLALKSKPLVGIPPAPAAHQMKQTRPRRLRN